MPGQIGPVPGRAGLGPLDIYTVGNPIPDLSSGSATASVPNSAPPPPGTDTLRGPRQAPYTHARQRGLASSKRHPAKTTVNEIETSWIRCRRRRGGREQVGPERGGRGRQVRPLLAVPDPDGHARARARTLELDS